MLQMYGQRKRETIFLVTHAFNHVTPDRKSFIL